MEAFNRKVLLESDVYKNGISGVAHGSTSLQAAQEKMKHDPDDIDSFRMATIRAEARILLSEAASPDKINYDGLIAGAMVACDSALVGGTANRRHKLDQWKYSGYVDQSYCTLDSRALGSDSTVTKLDASKAHFMMFKSGHSKIGCFRFNISNASHYPSDPDGDPVAIDPNFFQLLDLSGVTADELKIHAQRLEAIQHVLVNGVIPARKESQTQILVEHFLGELLKALPDGDQYRVESVAYGTAIEVEVEISDKYLEAQRKPPAKPPAEGKQAPMTALTDLVVVAESLKGKGSSQQEKFLNCAYNIEMKDAGGLKNSATKPKSQLIAESLARYLCLKDKPGKCPKNLYSILCDGYSICVMIHFTEEKIALMSHREFEPGRMVALLVWLHQISTSGEDWTVEEFKTKFATLIQLGGKLEDEMNDCLKKKRSNTTGPGQTRPSQQKKPAPSKTTKGKTTDSEFRLDLAAEDRMEMEEKQAEELARFSALRNYHCFGDPLPFTDSILRMVEEENEKKISSYEARLARLGTRVKEPMLTHAILQQPMWIDSDSMSSLEVDQ